MRYSSKNWRQDSGEWEWARLQREWSEMPPVTFLRPNTDTHRLLYLLGGHYLPWSASRALAGDRDYHRLH